MWNYEIEFMLILKVMEVKNCMLEKMTANFIKKMDFRDPIRKSKDENLKS